MSRVLEVPYAELGDLTKKHPTGISVLRVSDGPNPGGAGSSAVQSYGQQRRTGQLLSASVGTKSSTSQRPLRALRDPTPKDTTFAHWEPHSLPGGTSLEAALRRVIKINTGDGADAPTASKAPILKMRLWFSDNSEASFVRQNPAVPSSLRYFGFFSADESAFRSDTVPSPVAHTSGFSSGFGLTQSGRGGGGGGGGGSVGFGSSTAAAFTATRRSAGKPNTMDVPPRSELKKLFSRFDPNGNGLLSLAELDKAVGELWPQFDNKPAIMRAYKLSDTNGTGFVGRSEFNSFLKYLANFNRIWKAFAATDTDGDRRVSEDEFLAGAARLEPSKTTQQLRAEFKRLDKNGGGFVLFSEFCDKFAQRSNAAGHLEPTPIDRVKLDPDRKPPAPVAKDDPYFGKKYTLPMPDKKKIRDIFSRFDPNGNGLLSLAELDKGVLELWPRFNNKPALMRAYKAADANGTGFVGKREFEYFLHYLVHFSNLWSAFQGTDTSGDRRISIDEFLAARQRLGVGQSEQDARDAFAAMDANNGGVVLFEEFCDYMAQHKAAFEVKFAQPVHTTRPAAPRVTPPPATPSKSFDLQRTGLRAAAGTTVNGLTIPDKEGQKKLFSRFDPNGNGLLSLAELDKAVGELWPQFDNKPALMRAYKASDKNGTGFVGKREFSFFLNYLLHYTTLWEAFEHIDKSNDRRVSVEEFLQGAQAIGLRKSPEELRRLFQSMDKNGGGFVLFDEFCAHLGGLRSKETA